MKKILRLSIRDFALPSPRSGHIDSYSGYRNSPLEGIEIHQEIQKRRAQAHSSYRAEVTCARVFERDEFQFEIQGRMDGIFDEMPVRIEEIKTTFNIRELKKTLDSTGDRHPYALQLLTYGYFHWLEHQSEPVLSMHLVSTRNRETIDHPVKLDLERYDAWLNRRLDELVTLAKISEKRTERRRKIARDFPFPFSRARPGQIDLIETIESGIRERRPMMLQAPTGLGKTVGVLYPSLKDSLARGQSVIYVTPKNSQHAVAEDAVERFQDSGAALKSLTITAKSKMCLKAEPLCNPSYCEYARDYYDKVDRHELPAELAKKKKLTSRTFKTLGKNFEVCPYELQLEAVNAADVVICDYHYAFSARSLLTRNPMPSLGAEGKPNLVIDEAHNLPSRAMDYYSPSLSSYSLDRMREDTRRLPKRFAREAEELLDECIEVLLACRPEGDSKSATIEPPVSPFSDMETKLRGFLSRYLESDVEIEAQDPILKLTFYWSEFSQMLQEISETGREEFFTTFQSDRHGGTVKITCCDASEMLKPRYESFDQVVAFSATLKPFEYYSKLSGLESDALLTREFGSPFDPAQRKLLIIPQVSTKFSERAKNYPRIAEVIERVIAKKTGNYLAFFPSFDFLHQVLAHFRCPEGYRLLAQERNSTPSAVEDTLEILKAGERPTLLFAVQGGVFSEGVDYPGEMVIGAFVIGPPLPNFDLERETMKRYYQEHYRAGFSYAYTYPAMAKAVQAAGRVIRTESDRGIIILMDGRFVENEYAQTMPSDWFKTRPNELVSQRILTEIEEFWSAPEKNITS